PHAHASWGSWRGDEHFVRLNVYPRGTRDVTHAVLGFMVDDLGLIHERLLRAGVEVVSVPEEKPWGRTASFRDPDGNEVGLTELRHRLPGSAGDLSPSGEWSDGPLYVFRKGQIARYPARVKVATVRGDVILRQPIPDIDGPI